MIFNIQRFSLHDGEGIRTLIFFKGCPLRCSWCSNPESQSFRPEFLFDKGKCIGCRDCITAAANNEVVWIDAPQIDRNAPFDPDRYRRLCPAEALTVAGEARSPDAILDEVEKDRLFYRHGGGITLSGGEPFAQPQFAQELLKKAKQQGLATGVETCLTASWSSIEPCLPYLDSIYADLKHIDPEKYRKATGGDLGIVLANLRRLAASGIPLSARVPVIPGFNATEAELTAMAEFIASLGTIKKLHLMPYHAFGEGKYHLLDREYIFAGTPALRPEDLGEIAKIIEKLGLTVQIGG